MKKMVKATYKRCPHGSQKAYCKPCGGSQICEHNTRRSSCKQCKGSQICEHDHLRSTCKQCNGSRLCRHKLHKPYCKECGGIAFCDHNRVRYRCKECKGNGICSHGKLKYQCKECGGSQICSHGTVKYRCRPCGGSAFCVHDKEKKHCKLCHGSCVCKHGRRKSTCIDCGGSGICRHGKIRYQCKPCGGKRFCHHGKNKAYCKPCGGVRLCRSPECDITGSKKFDMYCLQCYIRQNPNAPITRNHKTKERKVGEFVKQTYPQLKWTFDRSVGNGSSRYRPDMFAYIRDFVYVIEVDENQHNNYDKIQESKRLQQLIKDFKGKRIVFVRFNPDKYLDDEGNVVKSCWKKNKKGEMYIPKNRQEEWNDRISLLKSSLDFWLTHTPKQDFFLDEIAFDLYSVYEEVDKKKALEEGAILEELEEVEDINVE